VPLAAAADTIDTTGREIATVRLGCRSAAAAHTIDTTGTEIATACPTETPIIKASKAKLDLI
jgi:hypothetical protein